MLMNTMPAYGIGCTTVTVGFGTSTFTVVKAITNQIGVALFSGSTGIEIAGAGVSYATQAFTLINSVTTVLTYMNSNGSSLLLVANGKGMAIWNTILHPVSFAGAPQLWLSAGSTNLTCQITYLYNDAFSNQ